MRKGQNEMEFAYIYSGHIRAHLVLNILKKTLLNNISNRCRGAIAFQYTS